MSFLQHGLSEDSGYTVNQSLRLRASNSAYLSRAYSSSTPDADIKIKSYSFWVKRSKLATKQILLSSFFDTSNFGAVYFDSNDKLCFYAVNSAVVQSEKVSTSVYRDVSAHMHVQLVVNTTLASATDRVKLYVNGTLITAYDINTHAQAQNGHFGLSILSPLSGIWTAYIGQLNTQYFDGYLSEIYAIDGQALDPSYFGQTDAATGIWVPKKYTGTYGANGFYLPFNDATSLTTLGYDRSGNGNNWTCNGISVTAGTTYDVMKDSPTNGPNEVGNYATLNPLYPSHSTLTNGNLTASGTTDLPTIIPSSGTWYFEISGVSKTWTPPAAFPAAAGNYNFGQQPFTNTATYPTLHTGNLPVPTVKNGSEHFQVKLDTGPNIKTACEALFTNELEWIKDRANSNNHQLIDSVRGSNAVLQSNTTAAETTYVAPSGSSVGWVWRASDSAPVTNTDGSITSTVSANVAAGFSIVTYTGTGANATVGHGLGVAPKMVIVKQRSVGTTENWAVYDANIANTEYLLLNGIAAKTTGATYWNSTTPTSTVFSLGSAADTNESTKTFVAYCFAEIEGYSKFGSYVGNGSADGPFVFTGFRPAWMMIKEVAGTNAATSGWILIDTARDYYNTTTKSLWPNTNLSELDNVAYALDILSNGFKPRNAVQHWNEAGGTYIYIAFAESPFALNNRAR